MHRGGRSYLTDLFYTGYTMQFGLSHFYTTPAVGDEYNTMQYKYFIALNKQYAYSKNTNKDMDYFTEEHTNIQHCCKLWENLDSFQISIVNKSVGRQNTNNFNNLNFVVL